MSATPHNSIEARLLARIPEDCGRYLRCREGWYELLDELDLELASLFPDYTIYQCKEKFGTLRFYTNIGEGSPEFACCETWEATNPHPKDEAAEAAWAQRWDTHAASAVHQETQAGYDARVERAKASVRLSEQRSAETCELCGAPGSLIKAYWVQVRCTDCASGHEKVSRS